MERLAQKVIKEIEVFLASQDPLDQRVLKETLGSMVTKDRCCSNDRTDNVKSFFRNRKVNEEFKVFLVSCQTTQSSYCKTNSKICKVCFEIQYCNLSLLKIPLDIVRSISCDCSCLHKRSPHLPSGSFTIAFEGVGIVPVYCDMETDGGGWTVFQRRKDGSVDFIRGWNDYERGFGDIDGDYWLGLASLHQLLQLNEANELRIDLKDYSGNSAYAKYSSFNVGDSNSKYTLSVSEYSGTAGDAINVPDGGNINGMKFSTKDQDNDNTSVDCASAYGGGWWFNSCHNIFLNGLYQSGGGVNRITWRTWRGISSLSFSEMKFRKKV